MYYLKILVDRSGNTETRRAEGDFNIYCPFCSNKNIYLFTSDANLFCSSCGKQLVTKIENIDGYAEEEIEEFIRVLKFGAPLYERTDAVIELGEISRDNKRYNVVVELLSKLSTSDPDPGVREHAMDSLKKLILTQPGPSPEPSPSPGSPPVREVQPEPPKVHFEDELMSLLDEKEAKKTPQKPGVPASAPIKKEKEKLMGSTARKTEDITSPYKTLKLRRPINDNGLPAVLQKQVEKAPKKKSTFNMEDDLLSLLDDV